MLQTKFNHQQTTKPGLPSVEVRELNAIGVILHFSANSLRKLEVRELNAIGVILQSPFCKQSVEVS